MPDAKGRYEGKIIKIVKRSKKTIVGTILQKKKDHYIVFTTSLMSIDKVYLITTEKLQKKDHVLMQITKYDHNVFCKFIKKIGTLDDPKTDLNLAKEEYNLDDSHNPTHCE